MNKLPAQLHPGEVIRITATTFTGDDIDVTVTKVILPIFGDGTVRVLTEELRFPLTVAEHHTVEVIR
jgi:hypothetical protein